MGEKDILDGLQMIATGRVGIVNRLGKGRQPVGLAPDVWREILARGWATDPDIPPSRGSARPSLTDAGRAALAAAEQH